MTEPMGVGGANSGSPRSRRWLAKFAARQGSAKALTYSKISDPPGISQRDCASSGDRPEAR